MKTTILPFLLTIFVTGCSVAVSGLCTACGAADDAGHPPDGSATADAPSSDSDGGTAMPDLGTDPPDLGVDPPDLGTDPPDAGPPDSGTHLRCHPGEDLHGTSCYYETTWTGITVSPRMNCFASGGAPAEWRSIDEQHLVQSYITGPSDTVGIGLYDNMPVTGDWRWLSDMSSAGGELDWYMYPTATTGYQPALTGSGAIGVPSTPMFVLCVRAAS